jgi:hypothetical protein
MITAKNIEALSNEVVKTALHNCKLAGMRAAGNNMPRANANIVAAGLSVREGDAFLAAYYSELRRLNP